MRLYLRSHGGELTITVPSLKEFLTLWRRGVIAADDLVRREGVEAWVPAGELPWIRGTTLDEKRDGRRLIWITIGLMILGLLGVFYLQTHASAVAAHALPKSSVKAVPNR